MIKPLLIVENRIDIGYINGLIPSLITKFNLNKDAINTRSLLDDLRINIGDDDALFYVDKVKYFSIIDKTINENKDVFMKEINTNYISKKQEARNRKQSLLIAIFVGYLIYMPILVKQLKILSKFDTSNLQLIKESCTSIELISILDTLPVIIVALVLTIASYSFLTLIKKK